MSEKLLTEAEIAAIAARVEEAEPGPWRCKDELVCNPAGERIADCSWGDEGVATWMPATADFIAHSREDIPRLLDTISHYRDLLDEARASLQEEKP